MRIKQRCATGTLCVLLIILSVGLLAGCQGIRSGVSGRTVALQHRIGLKEGGPHQELWQTTDFALLYSYTQGASALKFQGEVIWEDSMTTAFTGLERFSLRILFLNADGNVLHSESLVIYPHMKAFQDVKFSRMFTLTPETVAIAFSYRGRAWEGGERDHSWNFWNFPFMN